MKIAIVGSGIAGNIVAHRLHSEHDITIYEANDYIGGHTNTIVVQDQNNDLPLDTGFMVFNDRTYPNFLKLLDELNVPWKESPMSFSVQCKNSGLEYNGSSINTLFAQRSNLFRPGFHRMIRDILRFNREAPELLIGNDFNLTLAEYLEQSNYSNEFVQRYLIPMGAAIWSAEPAMMQRMPATFFVRFFQNHGLLSLKDRPTWRVICGGAHSYVEKMTRPYRQNIRLNTPVQSIMRLSDKVIVKSYGSEPEWFDYVFLACHSDQALNLLKDSVPQEQEILGSIPYQSNQAILHTDEAVMPKRTRAWAAWNYHIERDKNPRTSVTYHLNQLQSLKTQTQYFVTLNSEQMIRKEKIIRKIEYHHPTLTVDGVSAQNRKNEINGLNRTFYCGAYWRNGFHEDGVVSALETVEKFNQRNCYAQQHLQRAS